MSKSLFAVFAMLAFTAHAETKSTYVGTGRFTCQGSSAACAQIDQNNRRESDYRAQQYQREQDRAQAVVDRERREEERRNEQRRYP